MNAVIQNPTSMLHITQHAAKRMQQRNVPPLIVNWLHEYGAVKHSHGAVKRYFDKPARKRLARDVGEQVVDRLGSLLNLYIVEGNEKLITAGHRTQRFKRR